MMKVSEIGVLWRGRASNAAPQVWQPERPALRIGIVPEQSGQSNLTWPVGADIRQNPSVSAMGMRGFIGRRCGMGPEA